MRRFLYLVPLFAVAALVLAQEEPAEPEAKEPDKAPAPVKPAAPVKPIEVKVAMSAQKAREGARIGYSKPRVIALESSVPRFLFEIPKFNAKEPLFFRISLGETKGQPFYGALDKSGKTDQYDLLYLDRDRDTDLTNDGEPLEARIRTVFSTGQKLIEFLGIDLELPYAQAGETAKEPYTAVLFCMVEGKKRPLTVQIERDGWREGTVILPDGKTYRMLMMDDDSDGQYTTSDSWALMPEKTPLMDMLMPDATRSMLFPAWNGDDKLTIDVKSVDPTGREAVLLVKPAKETERAFFMRIAKQRQSPEERALDIDPLRPKITDTQKIDWIKGREAAYAIGIANSPNVQKPVLLFFGANTNRMSVFMDKYTFRDREVAALAKRFVCARIDTLQFKGDMKKYNVEAVPIVVVLTQKGAEITRDRAGFRKPREFAAFLKSALR